MHCRKCELPAVINMRHHRLALCGAHYEEWVLAQTDRAIEKYKMFTHADRILVAVSGGKDSLSLWDVLLRLGYQADGMYIGLGINEPEPYSDVSLEKTRNFLENRLQNPEVRSQKTEESDQPSAISDQNPKESSERSAVSGQDLSEQNQEPVLPPYTPTLYVVDIPQTYGMTIPQIARTKERGRGRPCAACGLTKRYVMNRLAHEKGYTVLATGHNLDDEVAVLFQNTMRWQTGYLARQAPVLPASREGLIKKVKPFVRFYERETATYALARGIDYIYEECPHAVGNLTNFYKTMLNQLENESPGSKLAFYLEFIRARGEGLFAQFNSTADLHDCEVCGQPTTAPGRCAFCRMWDIDSHKSIVDSH